MYKHTKTALTAIFASMIVAPAWAMTPVTLTDTNGDGVISAEEITQARQTQRADALMQLDTDGDGEVSRAERKAAKKAHRAAMTAIYDTDGDGKLSRAERKAAKQARRAAIESQLDVNQDGELSEIERAGFDAVKEERGFRRHSHKHDTQDGERTRHGKGRDRHHSNSENTQ